MIEYFLKSNTFYVEIMTTLHSQLLSSIVNYLELHNILVGKCIEEVYGGGQSTLEITIKKDGEMAGRIDIDYVG